MMDGSLGGQPHLEPELQPIALICSGLVTRLEEGTKRFIHMERLKFRVRGVQREMDALLCLNYPNDTYPTKLFLPENLGAGLNWNENGFFLGRPWFSWSWSNVARDQSPIAILAEHLRALA